MNPHEIKQILSQIHTFPQKRLGQHFLIDESVLQEIVRAAHIQKNDHVLEIGPGLGMLTQVLLDRGAIVSAIERDAQFVSYLEKRFLQQTFVVHLGDAVKMNWDLLMKNQAWKFVSNLPYQITSFALRKALWGKFLPMRVVVLVQKEVAERAIAKNGKQSLLSLMVALSTSSSEIVQTVSAHAFYPEPKVESAILALDPLTHEERNKRFGIDTELVMQLAKRGFSHPRKYLCSNLGLNDEQKKRFVEITGSSRIRAEDVSVDNWVRLARVL